MIAVATFALGPRLGNAALLRSDPLEQSTLPNDGPRTSTLALGKIESLPPGVDLVVAIDRTNYGATSVTERHYSCIEYALSGQPTLTYGDGYRVTLRTGDALWIPPLVTHVHGNAGSDSANVLTFSMRPVSERGKVAPGSTNVYRSDKILQPPVRRYYESLVLITLPPGFATAAVAVDAMLTFAVASGRASLRVDETAVHVLETGSASYVPALHRYELTTGDSAATLLVYSVFGETPH